MTKKNWIKALIFIVLIVWMMVHLTYIIRTNGDVKDRFVGFYAEKRNTIDAVIIGSSPVAPCIITPMIYGDLGVTMYPLSSNMQRPVATKYLIEEALKTQDPDLIILEMRMWTAADEDILGNMAHTREVTDNLRYSVNRIRTINAMVADESDRINYYFDIFKYHSNWKTMFLWSQLRTLFYSYPDDLKGSVVETDVGPADAPEKTELSETDSIPKRQEKYLLDLLEYIESRDLNVLFVITPFTATRQEQLEINYMSELLTSKGYDFVDMNRHLDEIGLDFHDDIRDYGTHTNAVGAEKVTRWFEQYLKEHYMDKGTALTADHRNDMRYKSWDKAYEKWLSDFEEAKVTIRENIENETFYEMETDED